MNAKRNGSRVHTVRQSQPQSQDSVPIGTGTPCHGDGEASEPVDLFGAAPTATPNASLKSRIFGPCLAWLVAQSKITEPAARKITGAWCAAHGDGAVLDAFAAAARQSPLDPVPYIEKVLSNATSSAHTPAHTGGAQTRRGAAEPFQARVASAARAQATGHLTGLRDALILGSASFTDMAAPRPDAVSADNGLIIDADCKLK